MAVVEIFQLRSYHAPRTRLMGLDVGTKTIGLALSDDEWRWATPLKTLHRTRFLRDREALKKEMFAYDVAGLVVGLPLNMDGREGPKCQSVRQFVTNFLHYYDVPVVCWDERLSTHEAQGLLADAQVMPSKRDKHIDGMAACVILQGALDKMNAGE